VTNMDCFISCIKASINKDYPGKITQSVFFNGCNLGCSFCPNPKETEFSKSSKNDDRVVLSELKKKIRITDCINLCGGEPLLQKNAVSEIIKSFSHINIAVKTNGTNPSALSDVLKHISIVDLYIVAPLDERFKRNTGTTGRFQNSEEQIASIKESIKLLKESKKYVTVHSYLVPGQIYRKEDFLLIAQEIKDFRWKIHPTGIVSKDYINNLLKSIKDTCPKVKVI
jgi:pyruvate-formate lyase-activating enzyme